MEFVRVFFVVGQIIKFIWQHQFSHILYAKYSTKKGSYKVHEINIGLRNFSGVYRKVGVLNLNGGVLLAVSVRDTVYKKIVLGSR